MGLFGSSRRARSSEARAAGKLPAARCARLCSSNTPLAPLASLCGRAAGTSGAAVQGSSAAAVASSRAAATVRRRSGARLALAAARGPGATRVAGPRRRAAKRRARRAAWRQRRAWRRARAPAENMRIIARRRRTKSGRASRSPSRHCSRTRADSSRCPARARRIASGQRAAVGFAGQIVDPLLVDAVRRRRAVGIGFERRQHAGPNFGRARGSREADRPIVVGADPGDDQVIVREACEPTVAQVVGRAGLAGDDEIFGQHAGARCGPCRAP